LKQSIKGSVETQYSIFEALLKQSIKGSVLHDVPMLSISARTVPGICIKSEFAYPMVLWMLSLFKDIAQNWTGTGVDLISIKSHKSPCAAA
jgi:hypothetical protein